MTVHYLDPVSGSDAADGLSFANRKKTIAALTAAVAGDTVRLIASPDPANLGAATWTNASRTVTWSVAKNKVIDDCETNWTAATNVTAASDPGFMKQGSQCQKLTPATAFTTGKLAYRTLPATLDLSAYEQVSFWMRYGATATTTAGALELKLCSDTTGDTAVHTIALPVGTSAKWRTVVWDNAAALSATVNSVALYATVDPGTTAMYLDNIVACKAGADNITHEHVIGKNTGGEPEWYSVMALTDAGVEIGASRDADLGTSIPRAYRGTTESVDTYALLGMKAGWTAAERAVAYYGNASPAVTLSGGWNRTDMSTQTGQTYLNGRHYDSYGIDFTSRYFINCERIGLLYFATAGAAGTGGDLSLAFDQIVGCTTPLDFTTIDRGADITVNYAQGMTSPLSVFPTHSASSDRGIFRLTAKRLQGLVDNAGAMLDARPSVEYLIDKINSADDGVSTASLYAGQSARLVGCTFANLDTTTFPMSDGTLYADDCTYTASSVSFGSSRLARLCATRINGADVHETRAAFWTLASETTIRHTASGLAWKLTLSDAHSSISPAQFVLAQVAVASGTLVTIKCWVRRESTSLNPGIRIRARSLPGVGVTDLQALCTAGATTWEELTLTFTPTAAGVVEVLGVAWGANAIAYFDDFDATQV